MAWYGDQELPVGQPRQQAVLGILAMRANRVISRGELVDAVWGQDPPASAEGGIYTYVAGLRRVIEPNRSLRGPGRVLVSSGAGYVLHLVPGQPDAVAFEQDLGRARQLRKTGDPVGAVAALNSALALWRGIAFAGVPGPFAETERVRLGELRSMAAEERGMVLPVPAQLPLDAPGFSGRRDELGLLQAMLPARSAESDESVPIVVISGAAGTGKTALAVRFGRQVAKRFPDGQLYVNLRGLD